MRTLLAFALGVSAGCEAPVRALDPESEVAPVDNPVAATLEPVRARERVLRGEPRPPWSSVSGPDPTAVMPWGTGFIGLLRGPGALVVLDARGRERSRVSVAPGATGWAREGERLFVVGEGSAEIHVLAATTDGLQAQRRVRVAGVTGMRAVAALGAGKGWLVADRHRGRIFRVDDAGTVQAETPCAGALDVQLQSRWAVANCMLEHRVRVLDRDSLHPIAAVTHDGPIWAMAPREVDGALEIALAGVEDHPLERKDGSFGYIDSFVFRVRLEGDALRRMDAVNIGAHGVVTPKALAWRGEGLWVSGAGGDAIARVTFDAPTEVTAWAAPAGLTAMAWQGESSLVANPLLDRWVRFDAEHAWSSEPIAGADTRADAVRVGEALVFTTLMAPQADSEGRGSRFTCETCHFEGTVDGRVHFTGRGTVHATTKTLRGLVGNQPHFSRALDRTTTGMIHNEFRVANANTPQDPWFGLEAEAVPWLHLLTDQAGFEPGQLRAAVLEFFAAYTPELNPAVRGRHAFTPVEARGAALFERACESCHQARTVADDPATRVAFEGWEAAIFGGGRLLWGSADRYRTGVQPYVHEEGPRVPSLRRLWVKRPYLTQGTADSVAAVLETVRLKVDTVHGGQEGTALSEDERDALAAFVDLL